MGARHTDAGLEARLANLERRLRHQERTNSLTRAMVDAGKLTVAHGGTFVIENLEGETILSASEQGVGISDLRVGEVLSDYVPLLSYDDVILYVDPTNGDDENSGLMNPDTGVIAWKATVQNAFETVPDVLHGKWSIRVLDTETVRESAFLYGKFGGGAIVVEPCNSAGASTATSAGGAGHIAWQGALLTAGIGLPYVTLEDIWLVDDGSESDAYIWQGATLNINSSDFVEVRNCRINSNGVRAYNVFFTGNSTGRIVSCERFNNATERAISATLFSFLTVNATGSAPNYGLYAIDGARIIVTDNYPTGGTANTYTATGGEVITSGGTANAGTTDSTQTTSKTQTWTATNSKSWGDKFGWRTDTSKLYQGTWGYGVYRGIALFNHQSIRSALAGRNIDKVEVYLYRTASGGYSSARDHDIYTHTYGSFPGGKPTISNSVDGPDLAWGQGKWKTVPNSIGAKLRDGTAKGLAIHKSTKSAYSICGTGMKVRITHSG